MIRSFKNGARYCTIHLRFNNPRWSASFFLYLLLLIITQPAASFEIGKPFIHMFDTEEIGGLQPWAIVEDSRGVLYVEVLLSTTTNELP